MASERSERRSDGDARDPETFAIIGAAMEVHRRLGQGFLEPVYQEAFAVELAERGIAFRRDAEIPILYRNQQLACTYRADFICCESIIVELKALRRISDIERAQVINYLKATRLQRALLLNFGAASLEHQRFALSRQRQ
jgi:GxxExxY protein